MNSVCGLLLAWLTLSSGIPNCTPLCFRIGSPFKAPPNETSLIFERGREAGAVMWKTCFPLREDRVEDVLEEDWLSADLKPCGGLYCWGARKDRDFESLVHILAIVHHRHP